MGLIDEKKTGSVSKSEGVEAEFRSIAGKETADVFRERKGLKNTDIMTYPQIKSVAGYILLFTALLMPLL